MKPSILDRDATTNSTEFLAPDYQNASCLEDLKVVGGISGELVDLSILRYKEIYWINLDEWHMSMPTGVVVSEKTRMR